MAQFGKISGTVTDDQGNPLSGATVEVRRQGAFVTSTQAGPTYTVNDPGGIVVGDQVRINAQSSPSRNVSAVTATTITTSGPGLGTMNNNDRITVFSTLPTLYADGQGAETKANPLTADASGFWYAWVEIRPYDLLETYGSTIRLKTDVVPEGHEWVQSNVFSGGPAIAYRHGTTRTITAGKLLALENPSGVTEKFSVDFAGNTVAAGNITGVNGTFTGTLNVTGNVSLTADLTVDDITCDDLAVQDIANSGTFTYSGAAGGMSLTAGSIETADIAANGVSATFVGTGTTDFGVTAAAAYADITGCTVTFTPFSSASEIELIAVVPMKSTAAAAFFGFARIVDGAAATVYHEAGALGPAATGQPVSITCIARLTGLTGSQTFKVQTKCVTTNCTIDSSTTDMKARIIAVEHKK